MIIKDAIKMLRDSVLKQVKVGEDDLAIIGFINLGVTELHKRFRLSFSEAFITPVPGKSLYKLDGTDNDVVMDLSAGELVVIECVLDSEGDEVPLNVLINPKSAKTPSYNTIRFGVENTSAQYTAIYRTSPRFSIVDTDPIPLSPAFIESLFHYVGYQAFLTVNGEENTQHNLHKKRFEDSIQRVAALGLYTQNDYSTDYLYKKGFV